LVETESRLGEPAQWRIWLFRVVATLVGLLFAINLTAAAQPWIPSAAGPPVTHAILHRWAIPLAAGPDAVVALALLYLAWRPRQGPLFLQHLALSLVVFVIVTTPFEPALGIAVIIALPLAAYPWPHQLLVPPWRDGLRWPFLPLALVAGVFLITDAWTAIQNQIHHTDELARTSGEWATNTEHLLNLWLAMLLVASRRPSRNVLAVILGVDLLYLGVVAFTVPNAPGSWGPIGGVLSLLAGLVYLLDLANEFRKQPRTTLLAGSR
jgi:hypothetical protein